MRIDLIPVLTASKAIARAKVTGKLSLVAVARLNMLNYYIKFSKEQIDAGVEEYKDTYQLLVNKFNNLVYGCPDTICDIDGDNYVYVGTTIKNPYNPTSPNSAPTPEPEPTNAPPTIDNHTITVENNVTTTLTLDMFITGANYNDPDGDLLDAVRIDKIYSNNLGVFYVEDIPVVEGQIITREQIEANNFYHVGSEVTTIQRDGFEFSVRDEGSQTWVN